jgi:Coatomer gamma subunit appendage platform subdomain
MYTGHVVLQLDCTNTLNDQLLENVSVKAFVDLIYEEYPVFVFQVIKHVYTGHVVLQLGCTNTQ